MPKLCRYDYHQANWETINNQLQIIDWDLYLTGPDKHKKFLNKIEEICEKNVPLKKTKSTKKPVPRERKILMCKRSRLRNKTSKLTSKHELQKVLDQIYRLEDNLKQHNDEERNNAEKRAIENIKKNPKCFYSFTKKYSNTKSTIGPLQRQNGDVVNNPIEMAEMLGQQYESVFRISATSMEGEDEGRTILVSGVPTDFRLEAIQSYFENKKRSSGGPIKGIQERIQDSGEVIITFESEKDAENVVKKKVHNVSKHKLQVDWYKNLVWQEDAMIVSNGPKDMSEKMLTDFLEENRKLEIVHVFPGRKPGTFLVYCQSEIDFEYVQRMCQNNPLKGNQLKVERIKEINSVQVKNVSSNVSSESLQRYFGNRKKSSGGDISSVQPQTSDTYIVSFKEANVVLDVCRMQHRLEGVKLDVQPFWEPSEENTISSQQVHDYLLPSKFHLTFLKKHKNIVNDQLKKWAEVLWKNSKNNKLKLKYSKENLEEIEQCLKDLLNSITVETIDVPDDMFEDVAGTFKSEEDKMYFYFDIQNSQAHILGFDKSNVIKMKNRLLDNLRTEREDDLSIHERRILSGLRFFEQAERQFEGLKVKAESNKVIFEGQYSKVANCQNNMYEILRSIVKSELPLPLNTGIIINNKTEYLDEKLRNKKCIGSWETGDGDSVILYASDKTHLSLLEEIMKETFVANTLDFVAKIKDTPNYGKWMTFVESLKEEFPDFCFIGENSIVAIDAVVNDIKSKIDKFEQSLIYESYISMPLEHFLFLKEFIEQEINDFGEKNKIKNVCLKDNKLHLEGTQEQLMKMEIFIENLRKDISSKEAQKTEEGNNFSWEKQMKSESKKLYPALGSETKEIVNVNYKNCEIVLREGDITTLDTDAIVNAANGRLEHRGGVAAAIVQKG
ncbi:protein mono-ADP-ribosyltransferase PARP14-like [Octopus vulgaris]|uniref:Protein mono-ADP-ribosyltransferase PARP14-like n=2 Tax=Octopus vulgaris TaxID=6645 RepID=A0AA36AES9_OCTVU|nr:protein mono-ADP-ribosyltransferase PARP14-like [Octopus vulgaris]